MMEELVPEMDNMLREISARLDEFDQGELPPQTDLDQRKSELAALLRAPVYFEPRREYVPSDALAVYYTADGQALSWQADAVIHAPVFVVYIRFSWVPPYVLIDWKSTQDGREWRTLRDGGLPPELERVSAEIRRFLDDQGYQVPSESILEQTLPGRLSELDDSPVSVREALFSALD